MAARRQQKLSKSRSEPEDGSERQCAVTRESRPPGELIRFVAAPDGAIVPDLERRLPGRGVWLTGRRDIVEKAIQSKAFAKSLKAAVDVPADLAQRVEAMLRRRVADALSLANKAGLAVAGFQQIDAAIEKGAVAVVLHGTDAAADGKGKLDRKFKAIQGSLGRPAPLLELLSTEEMSLAMGRTNVVHAALIPGGLAERLLREAERLSRYQTSPGGNRQVCLDEARNEG